MTIGCNARESTKMMKMPIVPFAASPAMAQNLQRSGATQLLVMRRSKPTISDPFRTNSTWEDPTESQHERWHGKSFLTPTASWRIKLDMDDIDMCIQIHIFSVYVTPSPRKSVDEIRHKMKFWNDMMTYLVATMAPSSSPKKQECSTTAPNRIAVPSLLSGLEILLRISSEPGWWIGTIQESVCPSFQNRFKQ